MPQDSLSRTADKYIVRLPLGMRDQIKVNAAINRRTMNAEIVHYLDEALAKRGDAGGASERPSHIEQPVNMGCDAHFHSAAERREID